MGDISWENFKIKALYTPWMALFALIISKTFIQISFFFFVFLKNVLYASSFLYISNTFRPSIRLKIPKN